MQFVYNISNKWYFGIYEHNDQRTFLEPCTEVFDQHSYIIQE